MGGRAVVSEGATVRRGEVTRVLARSQSGDTALAMAASGGHKDMVELLLDRGVDLEAKARVSAACRVLLRDGPCWASQAGGVSRW